VVFTRTKHGANRLAGQLEKPGFSADAIHGNKSQNARQRALAAFKAGECRVLVATDLFARGIDVAEVTHVINFELPNEPEAMSTASAAPVARAGRASPSPSASRASAVSSKRSSGSSSGRSLS
jgi:superfamily II DNA/RNA helicase